MKISHCRKFIDVYKKKILKVVSIGVHAHSPQDAEVFHKALNQYGAPSLGALGLV